MLGYYRHGLVNQPVAEAIKVPNLCERIYNWLAHPFRISSVSFPESIIREQKVSN
jgi:hypothetical protein